MVRNNRGVWQLINESILRLPLVEYILKNYNKGFTITIRELDLTQNNNYRAQLRRVKESQDMNIVIACSIETLPEVLKQAQQVGLMSDDHQFIITSLDMHTINLEPFKHGGTNITGFRLVFPDDEYVKEVTKEFEEFVFPKKPPREEQDDSRERTKSACEVEDELKISAETIQVNTALTHDAVLLFAEVMSQHTGIRADGVKCDDLESVFVNGTSIFNSMKTISNFKGLSGLIQFDQHGNRENFQLEILELATDGLKTIGMWDDSKGIQSLNGHIPDDAHGDPNDLRNKTLKILTVIVSSQLFKINSELITSGILESPLWNAEGNDSAT